MANAGLTWSDLYRPGRPTLRQYTNSIFGPRTPDTLAQRPVSDPGCVKTRICAPLHLAENQPGIGELLGRLMAQQEQDRFEGEIADVLALGSNTPGDVT